MKKKAIIIGAGPAGLTAAYELLKRTDVIPEIYEEADYIGGISHTAKYKGYRMDIGGHRFFSKSDRVMDFWTKIMPLQGKPSSDDKILDRKIELSKKRGAPDPEKTERVMLVRNRLSRIFYLRKFFSYPVSLSKDTFKNIGLYRMSKIIFSYIKIRFFPIKPEDSLADFYTNRFGRELYETFFEDYTRKLWGINPNKIAPNWGAQRVKGVSISKVLLHALKNMLPKTNVDKKKIETSLIDRFYYPKYGPGQLWEEVAAEIKKMGGKIHLNAKIVGVKTRKKSIASLVIENKGEKESVTGDYYLSTMPVKDLIEGMDKKPAAILKIASGLKYRDFIMVGLLLDKLLLKNRTEIKTINNIVPDTWMYIQERDVKMCRIQIFNNWSPYLLKDLDKVWIGIEYVCGEGDALWRKDEKRFIEFAISELEKIDVIDRKDVIDSVMFKVKKTYPAYFGTYDKFPKVREFVDQYQNLFLIGRNGMHKYNNMDHSMLTAMTAVDNIAAGVTSKENIWAVNTEEEYHEEKAVDEESV